MIDFRRAAQYLKSHSFARDPRLRKLLRRHGAMHMHAASEKDHVMLQLPTTPPRLVVVSDPELLKLLRNGIPRHGHHEHGSHESHHHGHGCDRAIPLAPPLEPAQTVHRWTV